MCWKALLGGLFRSRPSKTWPTDCSRLADGRRVQPVQSGISIQALHKIRIQVLDNHRPPHSQDTEASIGLKFPSQAVWSARLPGPCTPITLCFCGLLFTWACWAVAAVGRLALAPGHRLVVVVSLPSLVLPHNSASKGTAPSCAADRSCPSPVSRQLRHLRPLLLLLLCRPSWCRGTQALYFDKNCGLIGWSWLFLVDELVGVGRETRLVREGGSRD